MDIKKITMNILCVALVALALPVAAARGQTYDQKYNFKNVKNIYVTFDARDAGLDTNTYRVAEGVAFQSTTKNIGRMAALGKSFKFNAADANVCQLKLQIKVEKYDSRKTMMMGTNRKLLGKVNIINQSRHGESGMEVVHENYTRNEELPAYETESLRVIAEIRAIDTATGRTVWMTTDNREKTNGHLETTTRGDLLKRILGDFWADFFGVLAK